MSNHKDYKQYTAVWGFSGIENVEDLSPLCVKGILPNAYSISKNGMIYSKLNDCYITCSYRNNIPYINLLDDEFVLRSHNVKDLVACSFIENSMDYLERGYKVVNIDGNYSNCNVENLVYIDPKKEY